MSEKSGPHAIVYVIAAIAGLGAAGWFISTLDLDGKGKSEKTPRDIGEVHKGLQNPVVEDTGPAVEATREACIAFLREQVAGGPPLKAGESHRRFWPTVQADALEALMLIPDTDTDKEMQFALTGDGDPEEWSELRLRAIAIRIAGGHADGWQNMQEFLKNDEALEDEDLRAEAATAATRLPEPDAAGVLRRLQGGVEDLDDEVVAKILQAVATVGSGATTEDLHRYLANVEEDWDTYTRAAAAGALLARGDTSGEGIVDAIIEEDDGFDYEEFPDGLGARGNTAVLPWLERFLDLDDETARETAIHSIRRIGDASAIPLLKKFVNDDEPDVRWAAGIAIAALGDPSGLPLARECVAHCKYTDIRTLAWRVLGDHRDVAAKETAAKLLAVRPPEDNFKAQVLTEAIWAARLVAVAETP